MTGQGQVRPTKCRLEIDKKSPNKTKKKQKFSKQSIQKKCYEENIPQKKSCFLLVLKLLVREKGMCFGDRKKMC